MRLVAHVYAALPPAAGIMHSYANSRCVYTEAIVLMTNAAPTRIYPTEQLLGLPPQALICEPRPLPAADAGC